MATINLASIPSLAQLDAKMDEVEETCERVVSARQKARALAVVAVRAIERRLREALGEKTVLRGCALLTPGYLAPMLHGARVGAARGIDTRLQDDNEVMVLTNRGELRMARLVRVGNYTGPRATGWFDRPLDDAEILAEHLPLVASAVEEVLHRHLARTSRATATYEAVNALAQKLAAAGISG